MHKKLTLTKSPCILSRGRGRINAGQALGSDVGGDRNIPIASNISCAKDEGVTNTIGIVPFVGEFVGLEQDLVED